MKETTASRMMSVMWYWSANHNKSFSNFCSKRIHAPFRSPELTELGVEEYTFYLIAKSPMSHELQKLLPTLFQMHVLTIIPAQKLEVDVRSHAHRYLQTCCFLSVCAFRGTVGFNSLFKDSVSFSRKIIYCRRQMEHPLTLYGEIRPPTPLTVFVRTIVAFAIT